MFLIFQCVAEAVAEKGLRGLAEMVPGGGAMFDVAKLTWEKYRQRCKENEQHDEIQKLANATFEGTKQAAIEAANAVMKNRPELVPILEAYLTQIPTEVRKGLKRSKDTSRTAATQDFALHGPEDVARLLNYKGPGIWGFKSPGSNEPISIRCWIEQMFAHQRNARIVVAAEDMPTLETIQYLQNGKFADADGKQVAYDLRWHKQDQKFDVKVRQDVLAPDPTLAVKPPLPGQDYRGPGTWKLRDEQTGQIHVTPCQIKQMRAHQRNARIVVQVSEIPLQDEAVKRLLEFWQHGSFTDAIGQHTDYGFRWEAGQIGVAFDIKVPQNTLEPVEESEQL